MPEYDFTVDVLPDSERVVVAPRGELDHFTTPRLRQAVIEAAGSGWQDIVLDLRALSFMDSAGVHLLEELRDGLVGDAQCTMIDGVGPVALPIETLGGPRLLPAAELAA